MSRFYSALREASRSKTPPPGVEPGPVAPVPAATEDDAPQVRPVQKYGVPSLEDELNLHTQSAPERSISHHADVSMDQKARLIPHAVDPTLVEHYRRLRTKIMQQQAVKPFRSLVITSPNPGEGKSVTALNLGLIFAMLPDFRVVVVDGDLRKSSMGRWLGVEDKPGLSNLIDGSAKLEDVVLKSDESPMCFMISGNSPKAPAELLNSSDLSGHFRRLGEHFDLILVDSPPVNLITDTQLLASSCDAVLLVARAFSTTCKAFERTVQDLAPFRVIGTVLNGGINARRYGYRYGYPGY